jgi:hypothetical protein
MAAARVALLRVVEVRVLVLLLVLPELLTRVAVVVAAAIYMSAATVVPALSSSAGQRPKQTY